ncbi:MAG: DUF1003 domain-containing protein [Chlorobiaceae bacterium]|nr:DUF1003 domain-containing protein [Chlorobiaceae bacterium]
MKTDKESDSVPPASVEAEKNYYRFHEQHSHLAPVFGNDWFAQKAEKFARFFGTPVFLITQTVIVLVWIGLNVSGLTRFDVYPFILLNLAFSLQAAYAAPLILLAQTRQADRDKAHADADAQHREALAQASEQRLAVAARHTEQLVELLERNTQLTELTRQMSQHIQELTLEIHGRVLRDDATSSGLPGTSEQPDQEGEEKR